MKVRSSRSWAPIGVLVLLVLALSLAACEEDPGPTELTGYWVWVKQVEDGQVTLEVTDEDMEPKVGPSGWPDCPNGILCTRYGIHRQPVTASPNRGSDRYTDSALWAETNRAETTNKPTPRSVNDRHDLSRT